MKKLHSIYIALFAAGSFLSFTQDKSYNNEVKTYKVDTNKSSLVWTGKKVTGEHTGNLHIKNGTLSVEENKIKTGSFIIDLNSITVIDITDPASNAKLVTHLKGEDFFGVQKYPTAKFDITKVTPKGGEQFDISGNLTIKGKTNPVTFPATVKSQGNSLIANGKITIDRTKYDIKYKSAHFFEDLGDKAISDEFTLDVNLAASL